ncbi:MAG: ATP-binding protein [Clostridiales bacterium]|nr:ATP-binding protein [Clostridiales bacterium]
MVKLLIGHKGSGKTKTMIDMANDSLNKVDGSVVFINKNHRLMYELKYRIRVVCMEDFEHITNTDEYIGFIYGIISQDHDIEIIFIDSILRHADVKISDLEEFLERLDNISERYELDFVVSISADREELGDYINNYKVLNAAE